ncbi:hypothetical protein D0U02_14635 [Burkholderia pseudomallei]|uniref:Uncharacterized protein n=3 Tax=Burkholderia pseudomallei TaxID=28450 RepID=A0AAX0UAX3_BURPE|nr:hypothetical protein BURPS668_2376 [Burkholderia pseudomallei 668]ABN91470.1 hypothetical protein BURPS1106A_2418 [Burkholderia pseudomallei 1106a]AFR16331.1 hypothetical protein BPC006_I2464 [Burkholderia pseudomallei BPC006]ARL98487.1 hypothetical protein BOC58_28885 [Burkholderia pseudomallei]EDO92580.1 hypothetical protein BURPSPAST_AA1102 [Burkholderia pseudomallei Pasteur 52237]EDS86744.1 hypothetical protein BURPSS13_P1031 [Burkholderia pseudomallei S13]EES27180.1 hypothetical prote
MRGAIQADYIDRIRTSNARRTAAALSRRAFRARREQCSPRRHERAFQTSVRRARRGPSAAPGRFSPRSAIRPSA